MSLISICVPTYNGEKYLQESLDSIEKQTYKDYEVVISDDHSTDNTLDMVENFRKKNDFIVYIYHHTPSGIGANWNNCIRNANGEYIKFLFQDDVLEPECLETQIKTITREKVDAVCCARKIIDANSKLVTQGDWIENYGDLQKALDFKGKNTLLYKKKYITKIFDYNYNTFGEPDTFLYKKSIFNKIGYFNESYKQMLDLEFSYRILKRHNILIQREKLIRFRLHDGQTSNSNLNSDLDEYRLLERWFKNKFFIYLSLIEKIRYIKAKILALKD